MATRIVLLVLICVLMAFANVSFAGTGSGVVTEVGVQNCCGATGPYFVFRTSTRDGAPGCTDVYQYFSNRVDTELGKAMYQQILLAYQKGSPVYVLGKGTCAEVRNVYEDVEYIGIRITPGTLGQ